MTIAVTYTRFEFYNGLQVNYLLRFTGSTAEPKEDSKSSKNKKPENEKSIEPKKAQRLLTSMLFPHRVNYKIKRNMALVNNKMHCFKSFTKNTTFN